MNEYYQFELLDDSGKYYCKQYANTELEGHTRFEQVIYVPEGEHTSKGDRLGSLEIPNVRIKHIKVQAVSLVLD